MNKIVIPTGYMGSGSSAITDVLSEIQGYDVNENSFEFVMLHCPDGLFDLEDKLLYGNNSIRSDEAIHRFINCMSDLYDKKNYWVSGYKNKISSNFLNYCNNFVDSIVDFSSADVYWYFQQNPINAKMVLLNYLRRGVGKFTFGKVKIERPVQYKNILISFIDKESFYCKAKSFLGCIFKDLGIEQHHLVLDQFLLPHNIFRINNYFEDNVRVIVVDRDPRDMFLLNKYIWKPKGIAVPYPLDVNNFCLFYKNLRQSEKYINDKRVLRIHFEDLVYKYETVLNELYVFLGVNEREHYKKKCKFNPEVSIKNTQTFKISERYSAEAKYIEENLKNFIYPFPETGEIHRKKDYVF